MDRRRPQTACVWALAWLAGSHAIAQCDLAHKSREIGRQMMAERYATERQEGGWGEQPRKVVTKAKNRERHLASMTPPRDFREVIYSPVYAAIDEISRMYNERPSLVNMILGGVTLNEEHLPRVFRGPIQCGDQSTAAQWTAIRLSEDDND